MPHRCAFGCKVTDVVLHVFPNPDKFPERFKAWVELVGGRLETPSDYEQYKKKRICDIHFTDEHKNRFKRLNALAVPSLHLPSTFGTLQSAASVDRQPTTSVAATAVLNESHSFAAVAPVLAEDNDSVSRSSKRKTPEDDSAVLRKPEKSFTAPTVSETSGTQQTESIYGQPGPSRTATAISGGSNKSTAVSSILQEHNYTAMSSNKKKTSLRGTAGRLPQYNCNHLRSLNTKIRYLQTEISRVRKRGQSYKERLANAEKISNDIAFQRVVQNMTKPAQLFVHMQQQAIKKPKGRRFSIEEKILALSLYKKSPKSYRLLYEYFSLPSSKAMKRLLSQIKITPGINNILFEKIKKTMAEKDTTDRLCSLIFDEMSITPQLAYSDHKDELEGFSSIDENKFADHVLVFMAKGVKNNFKQPIAYYFTNSLNKMELKKVIKTVIQETLKSGLIIVSTVCDQSPVNVGAITEMVQEAKATYLRQGKEWRHEVMQVMGHEIVPLYDTPHLIKGLRNNLITKDMIYITNSEQKIIKWDYYQMVYNADKSFGELRLLDKLTEEHINPDKINKMRVKSATQLFSHSVAVVTEHLTARGDLPTECRQLIEMTLLIDNVFDSLNGSSLSIPNGKVFKGPVKRNSPHHELWKKAKQILKTVKYVKKVKVGDKIQLVETVVPSVTNLIKTIEGMEYLWRVLYGKYGLDALLTRNINQDPLENFFGNIRSYGARNIAPNSVAFEGAFKALLLNNFSSPLSGRANCEKDTDKCLQSLEFFLKEKNLTPDIPEETEIHFNSEICLDQPHENDAGQSNYVCGWVLKKCLRTVVKGCQNCRRCLLDNTESNENNTFIKSKEYFNKKWLCYPSKETENCFKDIQNMAASFLKKNVPKKRVKETIISFSEMLIEFPFQCQTHYNKLRKVFLNTTLNVIIYSWCRSTNRILSGKLKYTGDDETKLAAQKYYDKHKNYKNRK